MRISIVLLTASTWTAGHAMASIPNTMKAFVAHEFTADFDSIKIETIPTPVAGHGEVLVQVQASSVNPVDYKIIEANFANESLPITLGFDVAGTVVQVGEGCTRLKVGDRVWADQGGFPTPTMGSYAEFAAMKESIVGLAPSTISLNDAATIPLVGLTGYEALVTYGKAPWPKAANKTVLISAGQGGTGIAAVQLAKAWGATTVITAANPAHIELMKKLGADIVVDYTKDSIWDVVGNDTVDIVYENLGLAGTADQGLAKVRDGGLFVYIAGNAPTKSKPGVAVQYFLCDSSDYRHLDALKEVVDAGKYQPVVQATFALADVAKAFDTLSAGHIVGKIAIDVSK